MRRTFIAFASALLVVTACGQAPSGGTTTPSSAPSAAAETPVKGGTAIIAIWQEPSTLAPHYANQTVSSIVTYGVLEGLAETTNAGEYVPTLAKSVPTVANGGVTVAADKMDVKWELQPGLKWSDGSPVTSADIKFTWEIWMKDPKVNTRTGFDQITAIDTPNETTAVLHYKPRRSRVPGEPDLYGAETDNWVVYPFKAGY